MDLRPCKSQVRTAEGQISFVAVEKPAEADVARQVIRCGQLLPSMQLTEARFTGEMDVAQASGQVDRAVHDSIDFGVVPGQERYPIIKQGPLHAKRRVQGFAERPFRRPV